eukprot:COSAG03_NODE_23474_length_279_cov_1.416667_1_plen_62_part_01
MMRLGLGLAIVGGVSATYGDTHYGAHPTVTEAPHVDTTVSHSDIAWNFEKFGINPQEDFKYG